MTPLSYCSSRPMPSLLPPCSTPLLLPPFRASESVNPNVVMEVFTRRQPQTRSERNYRLISTSLTTYRVSETRRLLLILFLALVPSRDLTLSLALRLMSIQILLPVKGERGACFFFALSCRRLWSKRCHAMPAASVASPVVSPLRRHFRVTREFAASHFAFGDCR